MRNWTLSLRLYFCNHIICHVPSHTLRAAYYRHVMGMHIGAGSSIHLGAFIDAPRGFTMGTDSTINGDCRIDTRGGVVIGDNVSISMGVQLITAEHDLSSADFAATEHPIEIADYTFIGTGAMVLPGVTLGRACAVAAGAVVTRDVAPGDIVGGVPATVIGHRDGDFRYSARYRRPLF